MKDIVKILTKINEEYGSAFDNDTKQEVEECLKSPEMSIGDDNHALVCGVFHGESDMAYIEFRNENLGTSHNLMVAETHLDKDLAESYELGDRGIRLVVWDDFHDEDYTYETRIYDATIEEVENEIREAEDALESDCP